MVELSNYASDVARELRQSWDDRLDYPPTKITERYLRGDLAVLIELSFEVRGERFNCSTHVTNKLPRQIGVKALNQARSADDDQLAMLVGNVHVVDDQQRIEDGINSAVRLKFSDEFDSIGVPHSLYLSFVSGKFVFRSWPRLKNGKFDVAEVGRRAVGLIGKLPDNMIQTGSKMVNDFSSENAESHRDSQRSVITQSLKDFLVIELRYDGVCAFLKEPVNLQLEIDDILVGPF